MKTLQLLSFERQKRLNNIAMDRYLNGLGSLGEMDKLSDILDIQQDNFITDSEMQKYFSDGLLRTYIAVKELHLRRCEDSGVEYCICMQKIGEEGSVIL